MTLTEENYEEVINSYNKQDWQQLLDLIPEIENTSKFGELAGLEKDENGVMTMPFIKEEPIVIRFHYIVSELPIMICFDWINWSKSMQKVKDNNFDFNTIDIPTKCKLITAIVRQNRFHDGALVSAFESGLILKILKSIQKQIGVFK